MQFIYDPVKAKRAFIITLIFCIIFFLASGALGYLYWNAYQNKQKTENELRQLQEVSKQAEECQKKLEEFEKEKIAWQTEKQNLEKQFSACTENQKIIVAYNEFLRYMTQVIEVHSGYSGWTQEEYQIARQKAQATGNADFVKLVDYAWNDTSVDPLTRILNVYKGIISGIDGALK